MRKEDRESVELNKSVGEEYFVPCERCSVETAHKVVVSADVSGTFYPEGIKYWEQYQIIQCQGCKSISFRKDYQNTDDVDYFEKDDGTVDAELVHHEEIYPSRIAGRQKLKRSWLLPSGVSRIYDETHGALSNKLTILAGIGIRALIEAVCIEKNTAGANLKQKIDDLVHKGFLTQAGAEILHQLRALGNEAAHDIKPQSEDSLDLAMDVVENLLQGVYVLPEASRLMKDRKTKQA